MAFELLGIKSVHFHGPEGNIKDIIKHNHESGNRLLKGIEHYTAFSDWNLPETNDLFKVLDEQYPGSRFVYNKRDLDSWLLSRKKHVLKKPNLKKLQKENPKSDWFNLNEEAWRNEYLIHHENVTDYFGQRSEDLLEFDVFKGDSWNQLCPFLGLDVPDVDFPNRNKAPKNVYYGRLVKHMERIQRSFRRLYK